MNRDWAGEWWLPATPAPGCLTKPRKPQHGPFFAWFAGKVLWGVGCCCEAWPGRVVRCFAVPWGLGTITFLAVPHWLLLFSTVAFRGAPSAGAAGGASKELSHRQDAKAPRKAGKGRPNPSSSVSIGVYRWFQRFWFFLRCFAVKECLAIGCHGHDKLQLPGVVTLEQILERFVGHFQGGAIRPELLLFG